MKNEETSIVSPRDYVKYIVDKEGIDVTAIPNIAVISYSRNISDYFKSKYTYNAINIGSSINSVLHLYHGKNGTYSFCMLNGSIGSPIAAINTEELVEMGVKNIIVAGSAGCPVKSNSDGNALNSASVFNVSHAYSYEGTTSHYYKNKDAFQPCSTLSDSIFEAAHALNIAIKEGITATTDAIYRETPSFIENVIDKGANLIDMECAAIFGVAAYKGISAAAMLYHTDIISTENSWHINDNQTVRALEMATAKIIERLVHEKNKSS